MFFEKVSFITQTGLELSPASGSGMLGLTGMHPCAQAGFALNRAVFILLLFLCPEVNAVLFSVITDMRAH